MPTATARARGRAPAAAVPTGRGRSLLVVLSVLGVLAVVLPLALTARSERPAATSTAAVEKVSEVVVTGPSSKPTIGGPGTPAGDGRFVRVHAGGLDRDYLLLPALGLPPGTPAPLLVVLHQDIGSPRAVAENLGLDALRREGITLAYPEGIGGSWAAGACCGIAKDRDVDDVAFVDAVLRDAGRRTPIAEERAAVLGYSGGGMLLYKLLCRPHAPLIAAVEVNGSLESHCPDGTRLPDLLSLHGGRDGSVGMHKPVFVTHLGMAPRTVTSTLATVTQRAGCDVRTAMPGPRVDFVRWSGCLGGSIVEAVIVKAAGHRWEDVGGATRTRQFLLTRLRPPSPATAQSSDA